MGHENPATTAMGMVQRLLTMSVRAHDCRTPSPYLIWFHGWSAGFVVAQLKNPPLPLPSPHFGAQSFSIWKAFQLYPANQGMETLEKLSACSSIHMIADIMRMTDSITEDLEVWEYVATSKLFCTRAFFPTGCHA